MPSAPGMIRMENRNPSQTSETRRIAEIRSPVCCCRAEASMMQKHMLVALLGKQQHTADWVQV